MNNNISLKIVVAETSVIVRSGLAAVLKRIPNLNAHPIEVSSPEALQNYIHLHTPDIVIVNPTFGGWFDLPSFKTDHTRNSIKYIALVCSVIDNNALKEYDESIAICDDIEVITAKINRLLHTEEEDEKDSEQETLSQREKEIITCVVKGMTNKAIADKLYLSIHTVITHRRNIARKLQIHSPAGCIPHLMLVIIAGQAMVYLANLLNPDILLLSRFSLNWAAVMHGEVWRLFTFVFIPQSTSPLGLVLTLYFYYLIGNTLENTWGDFQFNVYYLCGMLGAILAAALTGYGTSYYINLSLFFAFAMLYPDFQVLLFFIIPIKMKYMALFSGALCLIDLLMGGWSTRAAVLLSLANFLLFFGGDFFRTVKQEIKYHKTRRTWQNQNRSNWR